MKSDNALILQLLYLKLEQTKKFSKDKIWLDWHIK